MSWNYNNLGFDSNTFQYCSIQDSNVITVSSPFLQVAITEANNPTLFNASEVNTLLWITTNEDKDLEVDIIFYEFVIEEEFSPPGLIPIKTFSIELNDTEGLKEINFRVYYNESELPSYVNEDSLRIYYYNDTDEDPSKWEWQLVDSGVDVKENYVWAKTNHLSLFGIFGSPKKEKEIVYVREEGGGSTGGGIVTKTTTTTILETTTTQVCQEKWVCTDWSECKDGIQTRTCEDENNCGTDSHKPIESQPCTTGETKAGATPITGLITLTVSRTIAGLITVVLIIVIFFGWKNYFLEKRKILS
ncbi:MAG: hypothetical protein QMD36_05895 [Candidatus Aenigmarchaeota archaeon]|nr:hypothetical protein [Candidatus Aenigmarchaeota archaeon]